MPDVRLFVGAASAVLIAAAVQAVAQQPAPAPTKYWPPQSSYSPPRTAWGDPDLQGTYDYQSLLPLQRQPRHAGKAEFTDAEYEEFWKNNRPNFDEQAGSARSALPGVGGYNEFWANRTFIKDKRTALIVDPPSGRIPPMTAEASRKVAEIAAARRAPGRVQYESWEDFSTYTRCINRDIPRTPQEYDSGTIVYQTPGHVVLVHEQLDTRIIPLDGRPHVDGNIRLWAGDSRGRWDGNTLVVETTNFTDKITGWPNQGIAVIGRAERDPGAEKLIGRTLAAGEAARLAKELDAAKEKLQITPGVTGDNTGASSGLGKGGLRLIERFVPIDRSTIYYYATFDAPAIWTTPWTFMLPWQRDDAYQLFEYACHEGDLSIENALRGERLLEKTAADVAAKKAATTPR
jgi:hypothetical protein